ncbi:nitrogen regulatory protein P-II [Alkaliphilus metalliredigens QYMF]|uniref:Nitrogen regulatory protein P-II n=1 Tax=Alkaliphilus metalliredigens (strain QYMF) TaxID=293826 RepID=A6TTK1_ALKMQ|nr:P-II family nitrogen regulator [Alkaliphilus metalliredigens]ABR49519.1 nitrogen regulatory protein P-II [Alkaliphilus metalliredigens QYMF]
MADKITKVEIITRPSKFDELKEALNDIGVTGMTLTRVQGCGVQKGRKENYRGITYIPELIEKIKIETVICEVPVDLVVETAKKVLYTGEVGDGKIFITEISNVIRIRNGDEGKVALDNEK